MASTLSSAFEQQLEADSDFLLLERGDLRWTRSDVDALARRVGADAPDLPPGHPVAVRIGNGPLFLAALLALRRAGAAVVLLDAGIPRPEALRVVEGFRCAGLLWADDPCPAAERAAGGPRRNWRWLGAGAASAPLPVDCSWVKMTSGSSGLPRGVLLREEALLADEAALHRSMGLGRERTLTAVPLSHSYGLSSIAVSALRRDVTLVLPESSSPLAALRALRRRGVTFFPSVPAWLDAMLDLGGDLEPTGEPLVISAGAPLTERTARRFRERFGRPIHTFYGASECGGITFDRTGDAGVRGALGTPVDGVEVTLVDADEPGSGFDDSERGLVCVRSPALASGYLVATPKGPLVESSTRFRDGRFLTTDLAERCAAGLRITGRQDDILNIRGRKVHPTEIQRVLEELEGVDEAFVFLGGEGRRSRLRAVVAGAHPPSRAVILDWCREHLADYKVPRAVTVVDRLPRTERGKLDRLRAMQLGGAQAPEETVEGRPSP